MKKAVKNHKAVKTSVKKTKAVKKEKRNRFFIFGDFSASSVGLALGRKGWKPAAAIKAMQKFAKPVDGSAVLSPVAIRNMVFVGRKGEVGTPAKLTKDQWSKLQKAAA